ncbi:hypothetical protein EVAR_62379_1 [Eumeta japonica]|uniref:Uncharacterized protein n=1 Tax=Eumeta variegata TaxID=151549 RepID=A0A4C1Z1X4_EUMVA|nr:hypothetical protein EVAR_62379_1 [Eumeta japonica]
MHQNCSLWGTWVRKRGSICKEVRSSSWLHRKLNSYPQRRSRVLKHTCIVCAKSLCLFFAYTLDFRCPFLPILPSARNLDSTRARSITVNRAGYTGVCFVQNKRLKYPESLVRTWKKPRRCSTLRSTDYFVSLLVGHHSIRHSSRSLTSVWFWTRDLIEFSVRRKGLDRRRGVGEEVISSSLSTARQNVCPLLCFIRGGLWLLSESPSPSKPLLRPNTPYTPHSRSVVTPLTSRSSLRAPALSTPRTWCYHEEPS